MNSALASAGTTSINAAGLTVGLAMAFLVFLLPRRYVMLPVVILICFMTTNAHLLVASLNFTMIRLVLIAGWLRVLVRGESRRFRWNTTDKLIILWVGLRTINYVLVWGSVAALVNRLGYACDIVGGYFLFRVLVRNPDDVYRAFRYVAMCVGPLALLMVVERVTGRNPFAVFGAAPVSEVRDGIVRCQGPFGVSILAGTFGATMLPVLVGMWFHSRRSGILLTAAIISSLTIISASGSSGPVLAFVAGTIGLLCWPMRRNMRALRWGFVAMLIALQLMMSRPVWFLMGRLTVFSGSTGWYRGFLVDMMVRHFDEWWLIGSNSNAKWHWFLADVTNQYILEALDGGLVSVALFIAVLTLCFGAIGKAALSRADYPVRRFAWGMGAALFAHVASFMSVSYFDQNLFVYYLLLAGISVMSVRPGPVAEDSSGVHIPGVSGYATPALVR